MSLLVEGKVALVTGAGLGIGRATAVTLAREGAKVVVADINVSGGEETVKMIRDSGGDAIFVRTDVSSATEVEDLIKKTVETYGRLDCADNNAGVEGAGALTAEVTEGQWEHNMSVNLRGVWLCMKYEIPQMLKQGSGAIVNTSSHCGLEGVKYGVSDYVASKHGVVGLTRAAALEYAKQGIRINAVCPGTTSTKMVLEYLERDPVMKADTINFMPIGRLADPSEIAEAVVWLLSDRASFVIGHAMSVDGGQTA